MTKTYCDRCGNVSGPAVQMTVVETPRANYDICEPCLRAFRTWLQTPDPGTRMVTTTVRAPEP